MRLWFKIEKLTSWHAGQGLSNQICLFGDVVVIVVVKEEPEFINPGGLVFCFYFLGV
jgi:hypothetical protein